MSKEKPSEFRLKGFLSAQSEDNAKAFREEHTDWVGCYFAVSELAQRAFFGIEISERDHRKILAYSILYRLLTAYQAVFLLTERGIDIETKILLRTMTEALLILKATVRVSDFAERYIKADEDIRRKLLQKTMGVTEESLARCEKLFVSADSLEAMQQELANLRRQHREGALQPEMNKAEIAREADMQNVYNTHFAFFSLFTHLSPSGMRQLFHTNENGEITAFKSGVYYDDAYANLRVGMVFMLSALSAANEFFGLKLSDKISKLEEGLERLCDSTQKS